MNILEKKISVKKDEARIFLKFQKRKGKTRRQRAYTETALEMLKEAHPELDIEKCLNPTTINNDDPLEHEWRFKLRVKETPLKKKSKRLTKTVSHDRVEAKSEQDEVAVGDKS
jgi:hypothetical protein